MASEKIVKQNDFVGEGLKKINFGGIFSVGPISPPFRPFLEENRFLGDSFRSKKNHKTTLLYFCENIIISIPPPFPHHHKPSYQSQLRFSKIEFVYYSSPESIVVR